MWFSILKMPLKIRTIFVIAIILLAASLVAGYTYAIVASPQGSWFTDQSEVVNNFTAGELTINAEGPYDFNAQLIEPGANISFDPCAGLGFLVTNSGTKRNLLRVTFEGHWLRGYHFNKASAEVPDYNGLLDLDDSAHFRYGSYSEPTYSAVRDPNASGFTDEKLIGPIQFAPLPEIANGSSSSDFDVTGTSFIDNFSISGNDTSGTVSAPGEKFSFSAPGIADLADGLLNDLFGPPCMMPSGFKLSIADGNDLDNEDMQPGESITFNNGDGFSITITKNSNNTFDFVANYPVNHIYVKGGRPGSNLYTYYVDSKKIVEDGNTSYVDTAEAEANYPDDNPFTPGINWTSNQYDEVFQRVYFDLDLLSNSGVYSGSGLEAAEGNGWSHITVYYCEPKPAPELQFVKLVQVSETGPWYAGQTYENSAIHAALVALGYNLAFYNPAAQDTWPLVGDWSPRFLFVAANTGNVPLSNIEISDDYFAGFQHQITSLDPGQIWFSDILVYSGYLSSLDTDMITVRIADVSQVGGSWVPATWYPYSETDPVYQKLGEYFYHQQLMTPGDAPTPLYVNICLNSSNLGRDYSGAVFKLYAIFEAIQYTNQMDEINWGVSIPIE